MSRLRLIYLILTVLGTVIPLYFTLAWLRANGWDFGGLSEAWKANDASIAQYWSTRITGVTLSLFILAEALFRRDTLCTIAIPATFLIGVSSGLPLYLFLRSRKLP